MDTTQTIADALSRDRLARRTPAADDVSALSAWLHAIAPAHLSPVERIELAERLMTRRRFLIGAGALALGMITGCGPQGEAAAPTALLAPTTASATPPVVALDEFAGLAALALGVKPASVFLTFGYASAKAIMTPIRSSC